LQNFDMYSRIVSIAVMTMSFGLTTMASAQSTTPSVAKRTTKPASGLNAASNEDAQLYRNSTFGFRFQIPYGWVDRSGEMQKGKENNTGKSEVLLAVFERPPDASGDTINSAVLIASESMESYPGFKKAEDYLGPLTELATAKGFKADGEPYLLEVEGRQLWRADFLKPLSSTVTMKQCTLVLLSKAHIVSFTFIAGSDDALDDLMDGLHFSVATSGAR
jgi:hypothetical protein